MKVIITALLSVFSLILSCKDNPIESSRISPYERWRSLRLHNYTVDQMRTCFCPGYYGTARLTVRSDTIASILILRDSTHISHAAAPYFLTIDSLFSIIHHFSGDSIVVVYNQKYGYPEKVDLEPQTHAVDGGVLYETSNLLVP